MPKKQDNNPDWKGYGFDQIEAERLVRTVWGDKAFASLHERGLRVGEEGVEVMQSCGATRDEAHKIVDMVFDKKPGEIKQEIGGVVFTLLALACNLGVRLDDVFDAELVNVKSKNPKHYREKQKVKAALGVSIRPE